MAMRARTQFEIDRIRASVERTRKISDKIIGIGPFSLGLDGVMTWIPVVGLIYSAGAGGFLLLQGIRVGASLSTLAKMFSMLSADALSNLVPIPVAPSAFDMLFTAHKWAADALMKEMDETVYYPGSRQEARIDPRFADLVARVRSGEDPRRRMVFLGGRGG